MASERKKMTIKDKNKISDKQKEKIKDLEAEIEGLKGKLIHFLFHIC